MGSVLQKPETLKFTSTQVGLQATIYLIGAVLGSLWFGYLTDRLAAEDGEPGDGGVRDEATPSTGGWPAPRPLRPEVTGGPEGGHGAAGIG